VLGFGNRLVAEPFLEVVHLGLHRQQAGECARCLVEQRSAVVGEAVLRQVANRQPRGFQNGA
jgi:hypothetical protein